jgi:hypothetical protein
MEGAAVEAGEELDRVGVVDTGPDASGVSFSVHWNTGTTAANATAAAKASQ